MRNERSESCIHTSSATHRIILRLYRPPQYSIFQTVFVLPHSSSLIPPTWLVPSPRSRGRGDPWVAWLEGPGSRRKPPPRRARSRTPRPGDPRVAPTPALGTLHEP